MAERDARARQHGQREPRTPGGAAALQQAERPQRPRKTAVLPMSPEVEAALEDLLPSQARFVTEYLKDGNGMAAVIRAGYSQKAAASQATALIHNPKVARAIAAARLAALADARLTADDVLRAISWQVKADVRKLFTAEGLPRPIHELSEAEAAMIVGVEVVMKDTTPGAKGPSSPVLRYRLAPREKYVEMAAKHHALLTDVVRVQDEASAISKLYAGRQRAAEVRRRSVSVTEADGRRVEVTETVERTPIEGAEWPSGEAPDAQGGAE